MSSRAEKLGTLATTWDLPLAADNSLPGAIRCEEICLTDRIPTPIRDAWASLVAEASEANAFAEPWFVEAGLRHLSRDQDIRLLIARDPGGRLIGAAPFCVCRSYGRLIAPHVENWRHHHDFLGAPIVRAGRESAFWAAVLAHLDAASWARGFLHVTGLLEDGPVHRGLVDAAAAVARPAPTVHRMLRAALASALSPQSYYEITVRKKKRKELARLQNRLAELGDVACRRLRNDEALEAWCDDFLALERSGWKGEAGSALACRAETEAFFRDVLAGAREAGRLEFLRLELDGRPLAMLVNFLTPPGSFSFKIAHDEAYARFSPGVLIQLDNLAILARGDIAWMDSCAAENHKMIDHLWGERRAIVRVTVPLSGLRRSFAFRVCRAAEGSAAAIRALFRKVTEA